MPAQHNALEKAIIRAAAFVTTLAAVTFVARSLGLPMWAAYMAGVLAAAATAMALRYEDAAPVRWIDWLLACGVIAAGGVWVLLLFSQGLVLPPGDPIAVPQLARSVAAGFLPSEAFPVGSSAHAYPPGYPLLFAPAVPALSPLAALWLFKVLTLATLILIPVSWAWLHVRLFNPRPPFWLVLVIAYAAFFAVERTLGFVTPFAGKNAVLAALVLFPVVTIIVLTLCRRRLAWPLAAVPLYGLVLVHFTMLHLAAAFFAGYFAVSLVRDRASWPVAARVLGVGLLAGGLVLLFNAAVLVDPRAGSFAFRPLGALAELPQVLASERPGFVTFTGVDYIPPAPFRGLVLLACCLLCLAADRLTEGRGLAQAALVYFLALLCSVSFALGLVPGGVKLDFVRWFAWPLQAAVFLCAGLAGLALLTSAPPRIRRLLYVPAAGVACALLASLVWFDARPERGHMRALTPRDSDLRTLATLLPTRAGAERCVLIGDSISDPIGGVIVQRSSPWNLAEAVSACRYINGSWMQTGDASGRAVAGFPSATLMRKLPRSAQVYFIGRPSAFSAYERYLSGEGLTLAWTRMADAPPDAGVWRARVRRAPPSLQAAGFTRSTEIAR